MSRVRPKPAPVQTADREPFLTRLGRFSTVHGHALALGLVLIGSLRIASTYTVFSHTTDEPAHIACGMQWLDQGTYQYEQQNPPLTRIIIALGPYLSGARTSGQADMNVEGNVILYRDNHYDLRLALARAGNLVFFWAASWMVFLWATRILGRGGAVLAVLVFTMMPPVLAHAGLATTDMGVTACFAAALFATVRFVEVCGTPSGDAAGRRVRWKATAWLGLSLGLLVLAKFSALVFYPAALLTGLAAYLLFYRPRVADVAGHAVALLPGIAAAGVLAFLVIWAGYRFSFGRTSWFSFPVPFPELYSGIQQVMDHNRQGHLAYFAGELRMHGWVTFFPTLLAVKLPLAVLPLIAIGLFRRPAARGEWQYFWAAAIPGAVLAVSMFSSINIGLRHILPMFPFLAVLAASGVLWLARPVERPWGPVAAALLVVWLGATSAAAHPDNLAYFNAIAGDEPERIVVDSDLDWGQDIKRLGKRLQQLGAPSVTFTPMFWVSLPSHGFPPTEQSSPLAPNPGWNAVQVSQWKLFRMGLQMSEPDVRVWPDFVKPTERVGRSILLYYVPPRDTGAR